MPALLKGNNFIVSVPGAPAFGTGETPVLRHPGAQARRLCYAIVLQGLAEFPLLSGRQQPTRKAFPA
ncbi:MAG: hypothetical protein KME26_15345 [Oscillatoria princeps RMCB-10]|nr:hypothetical protein [Oscillatoria princeps RMCB-10]